MDGRPTLGGYWNVLEHTATARIALGRLIWILTGRAITNVCGNSLWRYFQGAVDGVDGAAFATAAGDAAMGGTGGVLEATP